MRWLSLFRVLKWEPWSEAKIITLLEKGKTGEILEETEGWYKITINNSTGWVSADYFKKDEVPVVVETVNEEEIVNEEKPAKKTRAKKADVQDEAKGE